jgi:hypothetical protein
MSDEYLMICFCKCSHLAFQRIRAEGGDCDMEHVYPVVTQYDENVDIKSLDGWPKPRAAH